MPEKEQNCPSLAQNDAVGTGVGVGVGTGVGVGVGVGTGVGVGVGTGVGVGDGVGVAARTSQVLTVPGIGSPKIVFVQAVPLVKVLVTYWPLAP